MDERDPEKRGEKEHFFDRHAPGWDKETEEDNQDEVRALIEETGISAGDTVVEPGCGTGLISRLILEKAGKKGRLCGVDISNKMLDEARAKGLGPRASFLHSEASSMPFDNDFADAVVCFRVFPHFDDIPGTLAEFNRVLKHCGLLAIAHPLGRKKLNKFHAQTGGEVARDMIPDEPEVRLLLDHAGFEIITFHDREDRYFIRARKTHPAPPEKI